MHLFLVLVCFLIADPSTGTQEALGSASMQQAAG